MGAGKRLFEISVAINQTLIMVLGMNSKNIIRVSGGFLTVNYNGSYEVFASSGKRLGTAKTFTEAVKMVAA